MYKSGITRGSLSGVDKVVTTRFTMSATRIMGASVPPCRAPRCGRRSSPLPGNVTLQLLDDEILFGDDVFHQVADVDETDELAAIEDGQMAQAAFRHQRHTRVRALLWTHIHNARSHNLAHPPFLPPPPH